MTMRERIEAYVPERLHPYLPFAPLAAALGGMVVGLAWNSVFLHRIDDPRTRWRLFGVLCVLGVCLVVERRVNAKRTGWAWMEERPGLVGFVTLVCLSSLFNAFIVFYTRAAASWKMYLFGAVLLFTIAFARVLKRHAGGEGMRLVTFLLCSVSLFLFTVPLLTGSMGGGVFAVASVAALTLNVVVWVLSRIQIRPWFTWLRERGERPAVLHDTPPAVIVVHGVSWVATVGALAVLSLIGAIPPVPLVIVDSGVFHHIERTDDGYVGHYESGPWYRPFRHDDHPFYLDAGDRVHFVTALFAPTGMSFEVTHRWDRWDAQDGWVTEDTLSFPVTGGRDGGYRGWTAKRSVEAGDWRVVVLTETGREIGRRAFTIAEGTGQQPNERYLLE